MIYDFLLGVNRIFFVRPFVNPDNRMGVAQPHPLGFGDRIDKWHVAKKICLHWMIYVERGIG